MDLQITAVMTPRRFVDFFELPPYCGRAGRAADANRQFQFHEYDDLPLGSTNL
jgi:hypothetical protein